MAVGWLHLPVLVANTVAVGAIGVLNFVIADRYVFDTGAPSRRAPFGRNGGIAGTEVPAAHS